MADRLHQTPLPPGRTHVVVGLEALPVAALVLTSDGRIEGANPLAEAALGLAAGELVGQRWHAVLRAEGALPWDPLAASARSATGSLRAASTGAGVRMISPARASSVEFSRNFASV